MSRRQHTFQGKRIQPPDSPGVTFHQSTEEERAFALSLATTGLGPRAIARRIFREFGVGRHETTVASWIKRAAAE